MAPRFGSHAQRGSTKNSCPPPCSQCNAIHAGLHCQGKDPSSRHELPNSKSPIGMVHSTDRTSLLPPSEDSAIPLCFFFTCCWLCLIVWLFGWLDWLVWLFDCLWGSYSLPLGFLLIAFGVLTCNNSKLLQPITLEMTQTCLGFGGEACAWKVNFCPAGGFA